MTQARATLRVATAAAAAGLAGFTLGRTGRSDPDLSSRLSQRIDQSLAQLARPRAEPPAVPSCPPREPAPAADPAPIAPPAAASPTAAAALAEARTVVQRSEAIGRWTADDRLAFKQLLPRIGSAQAQDVILELIRAVNEQRVRPEIRGPLF